MQIQSKNYICNSQIDNANMRKSLHSLFFWVHIFYSLSAYTQSAPICLDEVQTNEPSLAIHPHNVRLQLIGGNVNVYFWSQDSGTTWETKKLHSSHGVYGDPVVKCSEAGRFYYAHLSKTPDKVYPSIFDRIVFQTSDNPSKGFTNGLGIGMNGNKMQDKPWFDVFTTNPEDPNQDLIALTWTEFDGYKSPLTSDSARIRFAISFDGGATFSNAITISTKQGSCQDNSETPEGACPVILSDGSIHVTWAMNEKLYYTTSNDSGKSWLPEREIATQKGGWSFSKTGFYRMNALPFLCKDNQDNLFLVWADNRTQIHRIYYKLSRDKGKTWSKEKDISPPISKNNNADCFLPFPIVDPLSGCLYVIYYYQNENTSNFAHVGMSSVVEKKIHTQDLSPTPFLTAGDSVFFGDYISLALSQSYMRAVWTSHSQGLVFLCTSSPETKIISKNNKSNKPLYLFDCRNNNECFIYIKTPSKGKWKLTEERAHFNTTQTIAILRKEQEIEYKLPKDALNSGYNLQLKSRKKQYTLVELKE